LKVVREEFEIEKQSLTEIYIKNLEELNIKMFSFLSGDSQDKVVKGGQLSISLKYLNSLTKKDLEITDL
jgi:hypothetical protein